MFKNININAENGVLATERDVKGGVGTIDKLVCLPTWVHHTSDNIAKGIQESNGLDNCRCGYCGNDRFIFSTHTEIPEFVLSCDNCERKVCEGDR